MTIQEILPRRMQARELFGDFWLNGGPVFLSDLRGRIILLDFWDYTCTACQRSLPYLLDWYSKYSSMGLVVVGIHTPKFQFGTHMENVQDALERLGVTYPVMMDNAQFVWSMYGNRTWPTKHLVDKDGFVRCQNVGDGGYATFERALQNLLYEASPLEELPELTTPMREIDRPGAVCYRATPEILAGYLRGSLGNVEGVAPESVLGYVDPGIYIDGRMYFHGAWLNERECMRWQGPIDDPGHVVIRYSGIEANLVLEPGESGKGSVIIEQDGIPLTQSGAGSDMHITRSAKSVVTLDRPRLYNIVRNAEFGDHLLRLHMVKPGTAVYSLTGVTAVIPELFGSN
jgi:thiol-disulfide isomerase/thioredoxin